MTIPQQIQFTKNIEVACEDKDVLVFEVPSVFVRSTASKARAFIPNDQIIYVYGAEHYNEYLTHLYGDWKKLPPKEKQVTHHEYKECDLHKSYLEG